MPLQGQTVDVPLTPMNQQATATGGPVGRLRALVNMVVKKITRTDVGATLRVEKRDGYEALPTAVRDPATGATSSKTLLAPKLAATYRNQLVAVFLAAPFVLSETAGCWESPTYTAPAEVLRQRGVFLGGSVINTVDSARVGSRTMHVWSDNGAASGVHTVYFDIVDDDGTVIRQPTVIDLAVPIKVASDGTQFWVVRNDLLGNLNAAAYDANGTLLGSNNSVPLAAAYFDVVVDSSQLPNGVFAAQKDGGGGVKFTRFVWTGAVVTAASTVQGAFLCSTGKLGFLRNDRGDGNLYLATIDGGATQIHAWQATSPGAGTFGNGHHYVVKAAGGADPFQVTGFVAQLGAKDVTVAASYLNATPTPQLNFTEIRTVTFAGVATLQATRRSLTVVSRPMLLGDGTYYLVAYYRSDPTNPFTQIQQSTFFLVNLSAPWQVCGRWENGTAYADATDTVTTTYYFALSSPTLSPSGRWDVPLLYRAQSAFKTRINLAGGFSNTDFIFQADVIGIRRYSFGPDLGQALECANELLLPGTEAVSYTGTTFAENGMSLVPEMASVSQAAGGPFTVFPAKYEYIAVAEWTNDNGDRVVSPAGPPITVTVTGAGDSKPTITGYNIHTSRKSNILISLYRTALINGVQSTLHYKVTSQLKGNAFVGPVVYNSDGTNTWSFTDNVADSAAVQNDVLYTDKGLLDRFPAPPFSVGCYAFDRAFVVGPDGAIWFSGEKKEGEALWFTPAQRIVLPTNEEVKAIRQLDNFLLVLCEGSSVFSIPGGTFPDATGVGTIPTPTLMPFTNGCSGFAEATSDGVLYTSAQGGIWMITRDLRSVFVGAPVQNDTVSGFLGSATDDQQRVMFVTGAGDQLVYDTVTGVWSKWTSQKFSPGLPCPVTSHKGRFTIFPGIPSVVYRQKLGQYNDDGAQIMSQAWIDFIRLGGIRNYKRVWNAQMQGERLGDHDLTVQMYVDDVLATVANTYAFTPASSNPLIVDLPPGQRELCSSASYLFSDSFPRGPSQGFALELMAFYVGLTPGLGRRPATSMVKPT